MLLCCLASAPLRSQPNHRSEMASQLLYGETCTVLERGPRFTRVRTHFDDYEGWVDARQFEGVETAAEAGLGGTMADDLGGGIYHSGRRVLLPLGALVRKGATRVVVAASSGAELVAYARRYLDAPYLWGGRTQWGIDCSGLVQMTFRAFGQRLPRDCAQQIRCGQRIANLADAVVGDVVFGSDLRGDPTVDHVGLISAPGQILHACALVREDPLDEAGIWNRQTGELSHRLLEIRRMLGGPEFSGFH